MGKGLADGRRYDTQRAMDFLVDRIQAGEATAATLKVYCAIRKFCRHPPGHEDFMRCWPSVKTLAAVVSKRRKPDGKPPDTRTVKREGNRLIRLGLIYRERRGPKSAFTYLVADPYHSQNVCRQHGAAAAVRDNESWRRLMATPERGATVGPTGEKEGPPDAEKRGQILQGPPVPPKVVEVVVQGLEVEKEKAVGPTPFSQDERSNGNSNPTPTVQEGDMSKQVVAVEPRPMTPEQEEERRRFLNRQGAEMVAAYEKEKNEAKMRRVALALLEEAKRECHCCPCGVNAG